jgi:predicted membrane protein
LHLDRFTFLRRIILAIAVLSIIDVVAGAFFWVFYPTGYFSGKSLPRIVSDLTFIEGAAIFFAGGLLAFFNSNLSPRAIALLVVGASTMGLSVLFGVLS